MKLWTDRPGLLWCILSRPFLAHITGKVLQRNSLRGRLVPGVCFIDILPILRGGVWGNGGLYSTISGRNFQRRPTGTCALEYHLSRDCLTTSYGRQRRWGQSRKGACSGGMRVWLNGRPTHRVYQPGMYCTASLSPLANCLQIGEENFTSFSEN